MDYDPRPALERLEIPILAVFGELDRIVPPERSKTIIDALAPIASGPRETVLLPGVGHQLRAGKGEDWSPAYWQVLETWFTKHEIRAAASR